MGWSRELPRAGDDRWYPPDAGLDAVLVLLDEFDLRRVPRRRDHDRLDPELDRALARAAVVRRLDIVFGVERADRRVSSAPAASRSPAPSDRDEPGPIPARRAATPSSPATSCSSATTGASTGRRRRPAGPGRRGAVRPRHGKGWEAVPSSPDRPRSAGLRRFPRAYASARFVVDDAAAPTAALRCVNSRVFDALATGALVLTDGAGRPRAVRGALPDLVRRSRSRSPDRLPGGIRRRRAAVAELRAMSSSATRTPTGRATSATPWSRWANAPRTFGSDRRPGWEVAERWGDYHFARALQRSSRSSRAARRASTSFPTGRTRRTRRCRGPPRLRPRGAPHAPGPANLLWQISHPDLARAELYDRYDAVFVASDAFAARMAGGSDAGPAAPPGHRPRAVRARPERAAPRAPVRGELARGPPADRRRPGPHRSRPGRLRRRLDAGPDRPPLRAGRRDPERRARSPTTRPRRSCSTTTGPDMAPQGFISNRLTTPLACGAFVISDNVEGIAEEFDGGVVTYRERPELRRADRALPRRPRGARPASPPAAARRC